MENKEKIEVLRETCAKLFPHWELESASLVVTGKGALCEHLLSGDVMTAYGALDFAKRMMWMKMGRNHWADGSTIVGSVEKKDGP